MISLRSAYACMHTCERCEQYPRGHASLIDTSQCCYRNRTASYHTKIPISARTGLLPACSSHCMHSHCMHSHCMHSYCILTACILTAFSLHMHSHCILTAYAFSSHCLRAPLTACILTACILTAFSLHAFSLHSHCICILLSLPACSSHCMHSPLTACVLLSLRAFVDTPLTSGLCALAS